MIALVLIWLASSVVLVACVCRLFALSGPDNPEKAFHTGYSEISTENWHLLAKTASQGDGVDRLTAVAGSGKKRTLYCPLRSWARPPVGKPLAMVSNRKVLLASLANWLGRRSNVVTDDFVDRVGGRAEKEKVVHCRVLAARRRPLDPALKS